MITNFLLKTQQIQDQTLYHSIVNNSDLKKSISINPKIKFDHVQRPNINLTFSDQVFAIHCFRFPNNHPPL